GHCAPQRLAVTGWQPPAHEHTVRVQGQVLTMSQYQPGGTLDVTLPFGSSTLVLEAERFVSAGWRPRATYTVPVERAGPGTDAALAGLALAGAQLFPPFDADTLAYESIVAAPTVAITPTAADCPQITVAGQPAASGAATLVPLAPGPNVVAVQSTAQDGSTRSYHITITRTASADAKLQSLALSAGTLAPAFDPQAASYTAAVPYTTASVAVTPTAAVSSATLTVNGAAAASGQPHAVDLQVGANTLAVQVLAEDGIASRSYGIVVQRAVPDTTARLAALAVSQGTLAPAFDPAVALYNAQVGSTVGSITVTPTPGFGGTATVNGTPAGSGGVAVALAPGLNTIAVQATAQDGVAQFVYTLRVVRAPSTQSARLAGLALSTGTPWPPVHPDITAYSARAASGADSIMLTPTAEDATATVRINGGAPVLPGDASAPLALAPGHNAFTLQITSSDGQLNRSYTLDVLRGQGNAALAGLSLSDGSLTPAFDPGATAYSATVPYVVTTLRVGVALTDPEASAHVAGRALRSGHAAAVALAPGANSVPVQVTSSDGTVQRSYMLTITRAAPVQALGDHPAQFAAAQTLQLAGGTVRALAAQDMDGDGRPDLLALEAPRPELALLTAQDGGGFGPVQWLPLGVVIPAALAPGDYLGQGWTDMLAPIGGEARLALNLGAGHMLAHPAIVDGYYEPLVAHDMDGDGRDDVAARSGSNAVLLHSLGGGRFAPPQVAGSLPGLRFVAAGDFDGDGHADLALISDQGAVRVLPGLPQGGFGTPWDGSLGVAGISNMVAPPRVADLDGDGRDDLAVAVSANGLSTLAVLRGQPGGGLAAPVQIASGEGPMIGTEVPLDLAVADFNGDGHPDAAVLNGNGATYSVAILRGQGDGSLAAPLLHHVSWWPSHMAVADFDGDGKPDLMLDALAYAGGGLRLLHNTTPDLAQVQPSSGTLAPVFSGGTPDYVLQLPASGPAPTLTPWLAFGTASVSIGGVPVASGSASAPIAVPAEGSVTVTVNVQARDGSTRGYIFTIGRPVPATATASPAAGGTASCTPDPVPFGGSAACTATPAMGYQFTGWTGACMGQGAACTLGHVEAAQASVALFAPHAYAVTATASPVAGGMASCAPSPVAHGGSATCTATASTGYQFTGWTGACAGQGAHCTLGGLTEEKASAALFAQKTTLALPEGPQAQKPLGLLLQAGAGWQMADAGTQTAASVGAALPAGVTLPHGVVRLRLEQGSQATVVLTYPQALPQGAVYYKYGKTADGPQPHWYPFPGAAISGSTVTLTLQDGGAGDDDRMENSVIVDPGGVALLAAAPAGAQAIPTLGAWALALLAGLLGLFSLGGWRRR
ncbi:MAG: IPTL-CTERM sorting domain-containing protein, partial [Comamonadaceae bacterium]|nr:IPTL-CTERM sorting domain-containing protein [Comamonadaceae bacterium]